MKVLAQWVLLWIPSTIFFLYALSWARSRYRNHGRNPPGPKPLPIIGNLLMIGKNPHQCFARLAKSYGPLMSLKLGQINTLIVSSPDMAREVLQTKDQSFSNRYIPATAAPPYYRSTSMVWLNPGPLWKNLRRICKTQLFNSQKLNDSRVLRQNKVRDLVTYVKMCCLAGEPVDIGQAAFTTVLNSISNTLFSIDLDGPESESTQNLRETLRGVIELLGEPNISDEFPMLAFLDIQGRRRRFTDLIRKLHDVFDEMIEKRMQANGHKESGNVTNDFLDSLLQCHTTDDENIKLDQNSIKSLLGDLLTAGTDATMNTIEWTMSELLRNPSAMEKAQAEVAEAIGDGKEVAESDIEKLPYLQAVVKESFRLHPIGPFLTPRRVERDIELCGYTISEGTRVLVNVWAMGRDGDVWKDPEQFMPERFLDNAIDYKGHDFELIPFGAGRRMCPGMPLAFQIVHLMLASLLQQFNWKLPKGMEPRDLDMAEKFGLGLAKASPLRVFPVIK